jgi:hypothetical protein
VARRRGFYGIEDMRPINELRMAARWKLGKTLAKVERRQGDRTSEGSFTKFIADLGLTKPTAMEAQRIGCMPDEEMARAFEQLSARLCPRLSVRRRR